VNIEFSPTLLDNTQRLTLPAGETTIGAVLTVILKGQKVAVIERNDKIIIISAAEPLPPGALLEKYVLFGFIQQQGSLEPLPFASIREPATGVLCESNTAGFYSLSLPAGTHTIEVSFSGCNTRTIEVELQHNTRFNLPLTSALLPEVQVNTVNTLKRDAGNKLDKEQTSMYSNMLGQTDPVRAVYLLPGNMETQETGGQLIVRGGEPGENLFLLDGNRVFNPAHLLGEIAVVNNTSVKSVKQYKNDFPGRYGGAVSSITAIQTKDGNMEEWHGEAEGGLTSGAITVEGPLTKNRTALMIAGRSSLGDATKDILAYDALFGDFHVKLTHQFNKNNKLLISGYTGNDRLQLTQDNNGYLQKWSNGLFTVNWNLVTGKRSFVNTSLNSSNFDNFVGLKYAFTNTSTGGIPLYKITAFNNYEKGTRFEAKTAVELTASPNLQFQFGGQFEHIVISPYKTLVTTDFEEDYLQYSAQPVLSFNNVALWYENEIRVGNNLLLRPGLYANAYTAKTYNNQSLQPRFFASYRLNNQQQLSGSYSQTGQVLHQVTSPYPGINREIWLPANSNFQPVISNMINLGYQYKNNRLINFNADVYYKTIDHLVNFSEKANVLFYNDSIENKLITGNGESYGAELVAERKFRKWKTLLSYTISWSWRRFDSIQNGHRQPYRYDRRHNLNWLFSYQPKPTFEISLLWHFHTGDWITIPTAIPSNPDEEMNNTAFKPYRGKVFNRVNINATWYLKPWKKFSQQLSAGVHITDHTDEYTTKFSTASNNDYTIDLFPDQLFKYTWYIAYNIRL
ncbi:MAG: carboxypeptidase-like regulatory domain-containing protein, partial [Niastella sp.]|uniref:TonB-dependent receptor n=1 Tax=Niastella sp. TaxID=1869183 RepID=UPI00389A45D2